MGRSCQDHSREELRDVSSISREAYRARLCRGDDERAQVYSSEQFHTTLNLSSTTREQQQQQPRDTRSPNPLSNTTPFG